MPDVEYVFGAWEIVEDIGSGVVVKGYGHDFFCKLNGCIDMRQYTNGDTELLDIFHICNLEQFIKELQELQMKLSEHWIPHPYG